MSAATADATTLRFTRDDILTRSGLEAWREIMGRAVLGVDLALIPERPFHSELAAWDLPGLRIAFALESGLRVDRSRPLLSDGMDDFALHICTAGTWAVSQRGREAALGVGDAALLSSAEVGSVTCLSPARCTHVMLPREALAPLVPDLNDAVMRPIPRDSEALRLLVAYTNAVRAGQTVTGPDLNHLVAKHVRDLVAVALGVAGDSAGLAEEGGIRAARLHAIKAEIIAQLTKPDLSVNAFAARHGIGPRYVQALFESEGTTFSDFVMRQRLARAHRLLSDPHNKDRRIGDIAFDVGFGDLSYFNRAFRRQYGVTPSDVRASALRRAGPRDAPRKPEA